MSATPPISQSLPSPNPVQAAASAAADSTDRSNGHDFAGALSAAGDKPARKPAAKQHDSASSGSPLPARGNQPPPNAPPSAAAGAASAGAAATAPGTVANAAAAGAAANSSVAAPGVAAPGSAATPSDPSGAAPVGPVARDATPTAAIIGTAGEELTGAALTGATSLAAAGDLPDSLPTPGGAITAAGPTVPQAQSTIPTPPTTAAAQGATPAASPPGVATVPAGIAAAAAPKLADASASKAAIAAATSAPTSTNSNATPNAQAQAGAPGAAATDATAQAAVAAAIAQGTSTPSPNSSALSDDLVTPDTGVTLQGVAAANDAVVPLPTGLAGATAAVTSASVTAASAAAIVQAVSASADSGATDKHSHNNSPDASVGAAQLTSNAASDTTPGPTPNFKVTAAVDTAEFGQGVADQVSIMLDGNLTGAKLQVNPPALGPIEIRIALQGGHAQVWMSSHSAVTRDALESTSSKLREMLGSQGFAQVSVDISQRSFQERSPQPRAYESVSAISGDSVALSQSSAAAARSSSGLLDAYA